MGDEDKDAEAFADKVLMDGDGILLEEFIANMNAPDSELTHDVDSQIPMPMSIQQMLEQQQQTLQQQTLQQQQESEVATTIEAVANYSQTADMASGVPCHQPPWQFGCNGWGVPKGGADDKNVRYCYACPCGRKWNQLRPDKIGPDGNPYIRQSKRAILETDEVRCNGYRCKICDRKLNRQRAQELGQPYCVCSKAARKIAAKMPRRATHHQVSAVGAMIGQIPSASTPPLRKVVVASAVQPVMVSTGSSAPVVAQSISSLSAEAVKDFKPKKMRMIKRK